MVRDLTKGSPTKLILGFVASMLVASMMSYVYNMTDSIMVGQFVSTDALGAISAASPLNMLLSNLSVTTVSGFCIVTGQMFGAGDKKGLRNLSANALYLTVAVTVLITVISIVICRPALEWMNTPVSFLDMATEYMNIIFLARIFSLVSTLFAGQLRALGDSKTSLYISLISGFANVCFNFLFLVVIPLGVAGAAWGTFCSAALGMLMYLYIMWKKMDILHFGREDAGLSPHLIRRLLANGIPLGLQASIVSVGSIILQIAVNGHGEDVVTGISTGGKLLNLFWIFFQGFESALLYFSAQNLGAGKPERIRKGVKSTLLINLGIGVVCFVFAIFVGRYVHMLFVGGNEALLDIADQYLLTQTAFFPFMVMLCTWRGALKGCGSTVPALMCGIIELISRVVVSVFFADNLTVLYFAGPAAWVATSAFLAILYPRTLKKLEKKFGADSAPQETNDPEGALSKT